MVKITVSDDCGNSPKKLLLKDLNVAFAKGDIEFIRESVSDDISWNIVGDKQIQGKSDFDKALEQMQSSEAVELIIGKIITHGKEGAVSGEIKTADGKVYA